MDLDIEGLRSLGVQDFEPLRTIVSDSGQLYYRRKEWAPPDVAELFHENTKLTHNRGPDKERIDRFMSDDTLLYVQREMRPDYVGKPLIELPVVDDGLEGELGTAIRERRSDREYSGAGIPKKQLSVLLQFSAGVTGEAEGMDGAPPKRFRAYPSGGGLYPVELYLGVINAGPDLDTGLYFYVPELHGLRRLRPGGDDFERDLHATFFEDSEVDLQNAAMFVFLTGAFWRTKMKYGPRGYRFALLEAGHLMQNVLLTSQALGLGSVPLGGMKEERANAMLGVNGVDEAVIYLAALGVPPDSEPERGER